MSKWYYSIDGEAKGPVDEEHIKSEIRAGRLSLIDLVFLKGDNKWRPISEFSELAQLTKTFSKNLRELEKEQEQREWVILKKQIDVGESRYNQDGPFSTREILDALQAGKVKYSDFIWKSGFKKWARIGHLPEFDRRNENREQSPTEIPTPANEKELDIQIEAIEEKVEEEFNKEDLLQVERPNFFEEEERPAEARGPDLTKSEEPTFDLETDLPASNLSETDEIPVPNFDEKTPADRVAEDIAQSTNEDKTPEITNTKTNLTGTNLNSTDEVQDLFSQSLGVGEEEESGLAEETIISTEDKFIADEMTGTLNTNELIDPLQKGPEISNIVDELPEEKPPEPPTKERVASADADTVYRPNPHDLRSIDSPFEEQTGKDEDQKVPAERSEQLKDSFVGKTEGDGDSVAGDFSSPAEKSFTAIVDEENASSQESAENSKESSSTGIKSPDIDQFDVDLSSPDIEQDSKSQPKTSEEGQSIELPDEEASAFGDDDLVEFDELTSNVADAKADTGVEFSATNATRLDTNPELDSESMPSPEEALSSLGGEDYTQMEPSKSTPGDDQQEDGGLLKKSSRSARLQDDFDSGTEVGFNRKIESEDSEFSNFDEEEDSTGLFNQDDSSDDEELSAFESFDEQTASRSVPIEDQDVSKVITIDETSEPKEDVITPSKSSSRKRDRKRLDKMFTWLAFGLLGLLIAGFGYIFYPQWSKYINLKTLTEKIGEDVVIEVDGRDVDDREDVISDTDYDADNPETYDGEIEDESSEDSQEQVSATATPIKEPISQPTPAVVSRPTATPDTVKKPIKMVASRLVLKASRSSSLKSAKVTFDVRATRGMPLKVEIRGESGKILDAPSYFKNFEFSHDPKRSLELKLADMRLTPGEYLVSAEIGNIKRSRKIFYGPNNADFRKKLRSHLKIISLTQQQERKALFYTSRELEGLSKELVKKASTLRKSPSQWRRYYRTWQSKRRNVFNQRIREIQSKKLSQQAYPQLIRRLKTAYNRLGIEASSIDSNIRNRRGMASPNGIQLALEFGRIRQSAQSISNYR